MNRIQLTTNIALPDGECKSFIAFVIQKIKVGDFPTSLVFLFRLNHPASQLPTVLGLRYPQLPGIRGLLSVAYF